MATEKDIANELIAQLRLEIDEIDESIIKLVKLRSERAAKIAQLKKGSNTPMVSGTREIAVFSRYAKALGDLGKTMVNALIVKHRDPDSGTTSASDKS